MQAIFNRIPKGWTNTTVSLRLVDNMTEVTVTSRSSDCSYIFKTHVNSAEELREQWEKYLLKYYNNTVECTTETKNYEGHTWFSLTAVEKKQPKYTSQDILKIASEWNLFVGE